MPQIEQLPIIFFSQLFWLAVVFGLIFFVVGRGMLPKIQATVDLREKKIADDLAAAQSAREAADETESAYRARLDASRAEAAKLTQEAKQASQRSTEAEVRKAGDKIAAKVEVAETKIRKAVSSARGEIEVVAAEATQEMVQRLTGQPVDRSAAEQAVKAELNV